MGKQQQKRPRRRNKDSNKKNKQKDAPNDVTHEEEDSLTTTTSATASTSLSALLGKIRHANGQTRLAALSALQQNVLLGQQQSNSGNNNNNNSSNNISALWQAVREQVLDPTPDLAIATTAATCLTEFTMATATTEESSSSSSSSLSNHDPMTAGWFLVLIGRLQECHQQQQQQQQQMSSATAASGCGGGQNKKKSTSNNNNAIKQQQWLALSLQCLHAICALLETNPLVMERLERNASLRNAALDTLWQWLDTASSSSIQQQTKSSAVASSSTTRAAAAAASGTPTPMDTTTTMTATTTKASHHHHHQGFDYWTEIQQQACRALHSMIEDKWSTLLLPWLLQEPKADADAERNDDGGREDDVVVSMAAVQLRAFTDIGPRILHQQPQVSVPAAAVAAASATTTTTSTQEDSSSLQVARLHMAGIYVSCHFGAAATTRARPAPAATAIIARIEQEIPAVLDVLKHGLVWRHHSSSVTTDWMIENLCQAHVKYAQQRLDDVLERDIVRRQDAKKESARSIARRLQAVKQQQQQKQQRQKQQQQQEQAAMNGEHVEHIDDQDEVDQIEEDGTSGQSAPDRTDARQVWQEALAKWYTSIQALELALEIFANLALSMSNSSDNDHPDGDQNEIMHVDDMNDDEIDASVDMMMHLSSNAAASKSMVGKLLQQDEGGIVNRTITVLQQLCQTNASLWQSGGGGGVVSAAGKSENDNNNDDTPAAAMMMMMDESSSTTLSSSSSPLAIVAESLGDLQSKAAAAIGHCFLAFPALSCWSDDVDDPQASPGENRNSNDGSSLVTVSSSAFSFWTFLKQCLEQTSTAVGRQGIVGAMVVALQSRPMLHKQMLATDLDLMLSLLTTTTTRETTASVNIKDGKMDESSLLSSHHLARDAIFMLGMLCNQDEQPVEVNEKVSRALLQTLCASNVNTSNKSNKSNIEGSIVVVTEILNVLMDMYGSDDDAHAMIFNSLDVLGHFQRTLPLLKQQISFYSSTNRAAQDADLLEGWKETATNASRFIQYKKGQC